MMSGRLVLKERFPCEKGGEHEFDEYDSDGGLRAEFGHCWKCRCWINTRTGKNETRKDR